MLHLAGLRHPIGLIELNGQQLGTQGLGGGGWQTERVSRRGNLDLEKRREKERKRGACPDKKPGSRQPATRNSESMIHRRKVKSLRQKVDRENQVNLS